MVIKDCMTERWPYRRSVPVTVRSEAWVCCRTTAGIVGSKPVEGIDVSLLCWLCVVQVQACAIGRSLNQRSPTECVFLTKTYL